MSKKFGKILTKKTDQAIGMVIRQTVEKNSDQEIGKAVRKVAVHKIKNMIKGKK